MDEDQKKKKPSKPTTQEIEAAEDQEGKHWHDPLRSPSYEGEGEMGGSAPEPTSDDDTGEALGEAIGNEPKEGEPFSIAEEVEKDEKSRRGMIPPEPEEEEEKEKPA